MLGVSGDQIRCSDVASEAIVVPNATSLTRVHGGSNTAVGHDTHVSHDKVFQSL